MKENDKNKIEFEHKTLCLDIAEIKKNITNSIKEMRDNID